jgi:acetylornithine deacetylase/succinyl-diaminopimelate desuccinylase-like protein
MPAVSSMPEPAWLEELYEWIRIPSISADPAHAADVRAAGEWLCEFVRGAGGEAALVETEQQPLALGEIPASSGGSEAPTVLLYGHFDVQPPDPLELWESAPFEPVVRDGWIYGRGALDDKGNSYLLLKAARQLASEGRLPVNIRIAFDGEEEIGGESIVKFLARDERGADACMIFDAGMPALDVPAFELGVRGMLYVHVRLRTGDRDLHSGIFGGAALNAVHALMQTLEAVVAVPDELRRGITPATDEERSSWAELDAGSKVLADEGARPLDSSAAAEFYDRTFAGPAVDVNGIHGGSPVLQKTVLPVEAEANRAWSGCGGASFDLRAAPPRCGPRGRRCGGGGLVDQPSRARLTGLESDPAGPRCLRARARPASASPQVRRDPAGRAGAGRQGDPDDPERFRAPGRKYALAERTVPSALRSPRGRRRAGNVGRLR